jgi:inosine-uridine nucleoside N-ribohydrolase
MARKVIIDSDMGTDDAVALSIALFDPRLEIEAITAVEGCVKAAQATQNLQAIIAHLDPDKHPRLGSACAAENGPAISTSFLYGDDGLGNSGFEVSTLQHMQPAEKIIIDTVRANPDEITIICLGPLTNIARAFKREPTIAAQVGRLIITGGCIDGVGNITACSEFNIYFDPVSAREVFNSRTTKTLIPLDVTRKIGFGLEFVDELPAAHSRVGNFLKQILPFTFRAYHQQLGQESITLNDAIGALAAIEPDLFKFEEMSGDVETSGELTRGFTVFDRRNHSESRVNMEVATSVNAEVARERIVDLLRQAGKLS